MEHLCNKILSTESKTLTDPTNKYTDITLNKTNWTQKSTHIYMKYKDY